jgi:hypothetical protein
MVWPYVSGRLRHGACKFSTRRAGAMALLQAPRRPPPRPRALRPSPALSRGLADRSSFSRRFTPKTAASFQASSCGHVQAPDAAGQPQPPPGAPTTGAAEIFFSLWVSPQKMSGRRWQVRDDGNGNGDRSSEHSPTWHCTGDLGGHSRRPLLLRLAPPQRTHPVRRERPSRPTSPRAGPPLLSIRRRRTTTQTRVLNKKNVDKYLHTDP